MTPSTPEPADPPAPARSRQRTFLTSLPAQLGIITITTPLVGAAILWALRYRRVVGPLGEHLKITTGILAVLAGAWAVVISYHRQRSTDRELEIKERDLATRDRELEFTREKDNRDLRRADAKDQRDLQLATRREYRERFANGVTLLGNPEPTIALAGVYALANLADDWDEGAQQCLDILCARLRLPWPKKTELPPNADHDDETSWGDDGEREIRTTILRTIATHLKEPGPTDEDPERTKPGSWSSLTVDLTGAHLPQVDFSRAHFAGSTTFNHAKFTGDAWFLVATFTRDVGFAGATFTGDAWFAGAKFTGNAQFAGATFTGNAQFVVAKFTRNAWFADAKFTGNARFEGATFTGDARFDDAEFTLRAHTEGTNSNRKPFALEALIREQAEKYPPVDGDEKPVQDG